MSLKNCTVRKSANTNLSAIAIGAAAALAAACGGTGAHDLSVRARGVESDSPNGKSINGKSINGTLLNGKSINGTKLSDVYLKSVQWASPKIGDASVADVSLQGTIFTGSLGSKKLAPADFIGAVFQAQLSDGGHLDVRFDDYALLSTPEGDVNTYAVSYETDSGWEPLCGTEPDGSPVMAIPVNGRFNYMEGTGSGGDYDPGGPIFTPACRHYAAAKCVELGYRPWVTSPQELDSYFQTCTRVLRADYCGDGTSYTVDGTLIDIYDQLGVQSDTETWLGEAEWGPKGALCMAPQQYDRFRNTNSTPSCYSKLVLPTCGSSFSDKSTLIIDKYWH